MMNARARAGCCIWLAMATASAEVVVAGTNPNQKCKFSARIFPLPGTGHNFLCQFSQYAIPGDNRGKRFMHGFRFAACKWVVDRQAKQMLLGGVSSCMGREFVCSSYGKRKFCELDEYGEWWWCSKVVCRTVMMRCLFIP